jgi:hypothetical protein
MKSISFPGAIAVTSNFTRDCLRTKGKAGADFMPGIYEQFHDMRQPTRYRPPNACEYLRAGREGYVFICFKCLNRPEMLFDIPACFREITSPAPDRGIVCTAVAGTVVNDTLDRFRIIVLVGLNDIRKFSMIMLACGAPESPERDTAYATGTVS